MRCEQQVFPFSNLVHSTVQQVRAPFCRGRSDFIIRQGNPHADFAGSKSHFLLKCQHMTRFANKADSSHFMEGCYTEQTRCEVFDKLLSLLSLRCLKPSGGKTSHHPQTGCKHSPCCFGLPLSLQFTAQQQTGDGGWEQHSTAVLFHQALLILQNCCIFTCGLNYIKRLMDQHCHNMHLPCS